MPSKRGPAKIDDLMDRATQALTTTDYFEAEALALEALHAAHQARDYERMARIVLPLQEARRQKRLEAIDTGRLVRLQDRVADDFTLEPGCYLIEPMLVGANGRDLRERADRDRVPVFVVVREPADQLGRWPVVMIGPETVRTKAPAPKGGEPTIEWMQMAAEMLGDEAIASVDPADDPASRVDDLLDLLGTCVEHEKLHQRLEEACREAAKAEKAAAKA